MTWCDECSLGFLTPRPRQSEIAEFYRVEEYYTHGAPAGSGAARSESLVDRLRTAIAWRLDRGRDIGAQRLVQLLPGTPPRDLRVCEIGCGAGELLVNLRALGCSVEGLEPDPAARRVAQAAGLTVREGIAEEAGTCFAPSSFDIVVMSHVLEHCLDPIAAVRSAALLLKAGGAFVCETPNNEALGLRRAGAAWYWLDVPRHLNFFTARSLRDIVESQGLRVEAVEFCGFTRQFQRPWIEAERGIAAHFAQRLGRSPRPDKAVPGWPQAWRLLAVSGLGGRARKYDSVRIVARRLPAPGGSQ